MYRDDESIKQFELAHARDRLKEEARHVGDGEDESAMLGRHLSGERESQRLMSVLAIGAVALLAGLFLLVA